MDLIKIEFMKVKNFSLVLLSILSPIPAIIFSIKLYSILSRNNSGINGTEIFMNLSWSMYIGMFLPMLIIYVVCSISKIENANNGWRQLMMMPIKRWKIYFSKSFISILIVGISLISFFIMCIIISLILSGEVNFQISMIKKLIEIFITIIPMVLLLFIISRNFHTLIVPLVVGILLILSSAFIVQSDYWIYASWTYPLVVSIGSLSGKEIGMVLIISMSLSVILFLSDLFRFIGKDVT
ncbi:MAG: ABC transporter permease [Sarcina sp.]